MTSIKCKGAVVVNAYWRGGDEGALAISRELLSFGLSAPLVRANDLMMRVDGAAQGNAPFSFAVYLDKDDAVARLLEEKGVRLFNGAEAIRLADDKMLTHIALLKTDLSQPKTIPSPLFFAGEDDGSFLKNVIEELGFPIVVKNCYGAFGRQVFLARNESELRALRAKLLPEKHIYQEFIDCGSTDLRVIVIGGKAICAMRRRAKDEGEFRANAELGGTGEAVELTKALAETAEKAANALGLCYAGVDLLEKEGGYLVAEVNSNAHFALIKKVTGVNVAREYAAFIARAITEGGK